jgi:oligoendopeptidase F
VEDHALHAERLSSAPHERTHFRLLRRTRGRRALIFRPHPQPPRRRSSAISAAEAAAVRFAERYRGRVAALDAAALAAALDELEALLEPPGRAGAYAGLRFAADTSAPANGALLQRVQERGSTVRNAIVFFQLEWVAAADAHAAALLASPALARRRHLLESMRRYRPHVLSEPEERILEELANTGERAWGRLFDDILAAARFRVTLDGTKEALRGGDPLRCSTTPGANAGAPRPRGSPRA